MIDFIGNMSDEQFEKFDKKIQEEWKRVSTMTVEELLVDLKEKILESNQAAISAYERTKDRKIVAIAIKSLKNKLEMMEAFDVGNEPLAEDFRSFMNSEIDKFAVIYDEDKYKNDNTKIENIMEMK